MSSAASTSSSRTGPTTPGSPGASPPWRSERRRRSSRAGTSSCRCLPTSRSCPRGSGGGCSRSWRRSPHGELWTYGDVAGMAGSPRAARAAGSALARLPDRTVRPVPSGRARGEHARRLRAARGAQALADPPRGRDRRARPLNRGSTPAPDARDRVREHGRMLRRLPAVALCLSLLAAACTGDDEPAPTASTSAPSGDASTFSAQVASSDLAADAAEAVQIGVFSSTDDGRRAAAVLRRDRGRVHLPRTRRQRTGGRGTRDLGDLRPRAGQRDRRRRRVPRSPTPSTWQAST